MSDNNEVLDFVHRNPHLAGLADRLPKETTREIETEEQSCPAFGFLRGLSTRALAVEFRFRDGNSDWFSYSHLESWRHNPSVGLLLKFTGEVVTLVLIRGSNLGALVTHTQVNLTDQGFQRHRILWVREMDKDELRKTPPGQPTIDRIEVAEFDSQEELKEWMKKNAPAFLRPAM